MFGKLKNSLRVFWRVLSGYGNCSKCGCGQYEKSDAGGDYCGCGHSYGDHW